MSKSVSFLSEGFVPQMEDGTCAAPRSKSRRALQAFLLPSHEIEALHKDTKGHYMKISSLGSFCLGQHFVAMRFSVILIISGYQIMTTWKWQSALLF